MKVLITQCFPQSETLWEEFHGPTCECKPREIVWRRLFSNCWRLSRIGFASSYLFWDSTSRSLLSGLESGLVQRDSCMNVKWNFIAISLPHSADVRDFDAVVNSMLMYYPTNCLSWASFSYIGLLLCAMKAPCCSIQSTETITHTTDPQIRTQEMSPQTFTFTQSPDFSANYLVADVIWQRVHWASTQSPDLLKFSSYSAGANTT
jgi:hypothetical protein